MSEKQVLIVEDEAVFALDLKRTLEHLGYGVAEILVSGEEVLQKIQEYAPDLILLDIHIKGSLDGIEIAQRIYQQYAIPIIYLTAYSDQALVDRAIKTQPASYLLKPLNKKEFAITLQLALSTYDKNSSSKIASDVNEDALDHYLANKVERLFQEQIARHPLNHNPPPHPSQTAEDIRLTPREMEVLQLIAKGNSVQAIADRLYVSRRTIEFHKQNMMKKFDVHDVVSLVHYAITHNMLQLT